MNSHYTRAELISYSRDIVTIDGPAGAGKSSVARGLARILGYSYLDTGAMYRAIALRLFEKGANFIDEPSIEPLLDEISLQVEFTDTANRLIVDGKDYTEPIRSAEASRLSSQAGTLLVVRQRLVFLQRDIGRLGRIVVEGRDMGTVVFPLAWYKFYLTASVEERGRRRYLEDSARHKSVTLEETIAAIKERDMRDEQRKHAPLKPAVDAIFIDTTELTIDQVIASIVSEIQNKNKSTGAL